MQILNGFPKHQKYSKIQLMEKVMSVIEIESELEK